MCVDAQLSPLWSFPKFGRTQNRSTKFLRMYANKKLLEFLRICADYFSVEFLRPYAKSSVPLLGICVSTQINNFWSFCGYAQLLESEKVTLAPTIRRSSNTGVSVSVRKKAPRLYLDCRPDGHTLPPPGNFADIPYLKEQFFLHRIRDVCTL